MEEKTLYVINGVAYEEPLEVCKLLMREFKFTRGVSELFYTDDALDYVVHNGWEISDFHSVNYVDFFLPVSFEINDYTFSTLTLEHSNLKYLEHDYEYYEDLYNKYKVMYDTINQDENLRNQFEFEDLYKLSNILECCKTNLKYQKLYNELANSDSFYRDVFRLFLREGLNNHHFKEDFWYLLDITDYNTYFRMTIDEMINLTPPTFTLTKHAVCKSTIINGIKLAYDGKLSSKSVIALMTVMTKWVDIDKGLVKEVKRLTKG